MATKITGWLLLCCLTVAFGSSFLYGFNIAKINTPSAIIKSFFNETYTQRYGKPFSKYTLNILWSFTVSVYVGFGAIGSFMSGKIADTIGRKRGLLLNHSLAVVGSLLEGICKHTGLPELLMLGRAINGLNCGITLGLAPMYLIEISPQSIRGAIGNLHQVGVVFGILVAQIVGIEQLLGNEELWPLLLAFTGIPPILACFALPFCPESPRYLLLSKNDEGGARKAMRKMHTDLAELEAAVADMRKESLASTDAIDRFRYFDLFKARKLRMALFVCIALMICQQWSGINAIFAYSTIIFKAAGLSADKVQYAIVGTGVVNVLMTFVNLPLMEKAGRRALIFYPCILMLTAMFLMTFTVLLQSSISWFSYLSVALMLIYILGFAVGLGPIPCMITSESFRQGPRGAAVGLVQGTHWFMNLIVTFVFPFMVERMGSYVFLVYSAICIVCLAFVLLFLPETMGRSLDEIVNDFKRGYMWRPCAPPKYFYADKVKKANESLIVKE